MKSINGNDSNFGKAPIREVRSAMLDSVIYLTDTSAIMVTSDYCLRNGVYTPVASQEMTTRNRGSLWRAGRDTVYNHPLFSRKHALDSIRTAIKSEYYFKNDIDSTQFVGYDNVAPETQKVAKQPAEKNGNEVYLLLVFVIALLLFSMVPAARSSKAAR